MSDPQEHELWSTWRDASRREDVDAAIRGLYARLDAAVAERGPTCWQSGKCCNFDAYGHLLYVTGLEIAWFVNQGPGIGDQGSGQTSIDRSRAFALPLIPDPRPLNPASCPYQQNHLCTTHAIRPLGCRVFFCQAGTQDWQNELYERMLGELRAMHEGLGLPYRYMEWRAGLRAAGQHLADDR